jgi:hypothetical protein
LPGIILAHRGYRPAPGQRVPRHPLLVGRHKETRTGEPSPAARPPRLWLGRSLNRDIAPLEFPKMEALDMQLERFSGPRPG